MGKLIELLNSRTNRCKSLAKRMKENESKQSQEEDKMIRRECRLLLIDLLGNSDDSELINSLLVYLDGENEKSNQRTK